jgi:hypothetical protein
MKCEVLNGGEDVDVGLFSVIGVEATQVTKQSRYTPWWRMQGEEI